MATSLLATKLFRPRARPGAVGRPALLARLDEGIDSRLTIISAPAGFGKTSLLAEWMARRNHRIAWVSLDAEHRDPGRQMAYLVAAVHSAVDGLGNEVAAAIDLARSAPLSTAVTALINALSYVPGRLIIILDDYHLAEGEQSTGIFRQLLEHLPAQVRVVIASRSQPQLPLARLRARGQLTEIGADELRFTEREAGDFLRNVLGIELDAAATAELTRRTEGWIAGLQLAGLALRGRDDPRTFVDSYSGRDRLVADYLVEEVVDQQPIGVRTFLEQTSILERMSGPLCDAVLQTTPGTCQTYLERLEHDKLFIVPLDDDRTWYRYHHMFGQVLRRRLEQGRGAEGAHGQPSVADLHARASRWYEHHGHQIEAFTQAAASGDVDRAAALIGEGTPLPYRGAATLVLEWLESLPPQAFADRPELGVWFALASVLLGRNAKVEHTLVAAEAALARAGGSDAQSAARSHAATVRSMLATATEDPRAMQAEAQRVLQSPTAANDATARIAARCALAYAMHLDGDGDSALQEYAAILAEASDTNVVFRVAALIGRGQVEEARGDLAAALSSFEAAIEASGEPPLPYACEAYLGLARIHYDWNELDAAAAHADEAIRLGSMIDCIDTPAAGHLILARVALARSRLTAAMEHLGDAEHVATERRALHVHGLLADGVARLAIATDGPNALMRASRFSESRTATTSARLQLASGHAREALATLESECDQAPGRRPMRDRLDALVLSALAHAELGDDDTAIATLREAMILAEPGGFVRVFVDAGAGVLPLVTRVDHLTTMRPTLLEAFDSCRTSADETSASASLSGEALLEPLSAAELAVLRLIAEGHPNGVIARRLFRAVSTIKGHNRSLFAKLQVRNRTEAVARARSIGLL